MFAWFQRILDGIGCRREVLADKRRDELRQDLAFYQDVFVWCKKHGREEDAMRWDFMIRRAKEELDECD